MKAYGQYALYREKDFSKSIENLQKEIAGNKSSITEVKETVDFLNGEIGNTVSRNEFNDRILGITSDIDKVNQGDGKWLVQLYNTDSSTSVLEDRESILPEENREHYILLMQYGVRMLSRILHKYNLLMIFLISIKVQHMLVMHIRSYTAQLSSKIRYLSLLLIMLCLY